MGSLFVGALALCEGIIIGVHLQRSGKADLIEAKLREKFNEMTKTKEVEPKQSTVVEFGEVVS
jgi:hypothetical protein